MGGVEAGGVGKLSEIGGTMRDKALQLTKDPFLTRRYFVVQTRERTTTGSVRQWKLTSLHARSPSVIASACHLPAGALPSGPGWVQACGTLSISLSRMAASFLSQGVSFLSTLFHIGATSFSYNDCLLLNLIKSTYHL